MAHAHTSEQQGRLLGEMEMVLVASSNEAISAVPLKAETPNSMRKQQLSTLSGILNPDIIVSQVQMRGGDLIPNAWCVAQSVMKC